MTEPMQREPAPQTQTPTTQLQMLAPDGDLLTFEGIAQMAEVSMEVLRHYAKIGNQNLVNAVEQDPRHFSPLEKR